MAAKAVQGADSPAAPCRSADRRSPALTALVGCDARGWRRRRGGEAGGAARMAARRGAAGDARAVAWRAEALTVNENGDACVAQSLRLSLCASRSLRCSEHQRVQRTHRWHGWLSRPPCSKAAHAGTTARTSHSAQRICVCAKLVVDSTYLDRVEAPLWSDDLDVPELALVGMLLGVYVSVLLIVLIHSIGG
jgi:hypothetical protein